MHTHQCDECGEIWECQGSVCRGRRERTCPDCNLSLGLEALDEGDEEEEA